MTNALATGLNIFRVNTFPSVPGKISIANYATLLEITLNNTNMLLLKSWILKKEFGNDLGKPLPINFITPPKIEPVEDSIVSICILTCRSNGFD